MMRRAAALLLALLTATALPAAKPVPPGEAPLADAAAQPASEAWRSQGVPVCVARLRANRAFTPDDLETICGCTFDGYLEGHGTEPLPGLENDRVPVAMEQQLLNCTSRTRPDQREAVRQLGVIWAPGAPPIPGGGRLQDPKPPGEPGFGPSEESQASVDSGGGFWDWVSAITLPAWLAGVSVLWWIALGIFVFGLLILKVRRRDPRNDLMGPPSSLRRGAPPRPPRRPDLPR
jgi:hypothetical protein